MRLHADLSIPDPNDVKRRAKTAKSHRRIPLVEPPSLTREGLALIEAAVPPGAAAGERYAPQQMAQREAPRLNGAALAAHPAGEGAPPGNSSKRSSRSGGACR